MAMCEEIGKNIPYHALPFPLVFGLSGDRVEKFQEEEKLHLFLKGSWAELRRDVVGGSGKGPSIIDARKIFGPLDPLPLVCTGPLEEFTQPP